MGIEHTPSNLYMGNAVRLDSMPYIRYAEQLRARQQAKDEALDQYFQKLPLGINQAGLRLQDQPQFVDKANEIRDYYNANKDKIKNPRLDRGVSQAEYQRRIQDASLFVQKSKQEEEKKKPLIPLLGDPKKRALMTDDVITMIDLHDLPLNDPRRKSLDYSAEWFNPPPHDQQKFFGGLKGIKMDVTVNEAPDPDNPLRKTQVKNFKFNKDAINAIVQYAETEYDTKPGFRKYVNEVLSKPQEYNDLNEAFKKQFGKDIDATHPKDLAIAYTLIGKKLDYANQTMIDDKKAIMDLNYARQKERDRWRVANRASATNQDGTTNVVDIFAEMDNKASVKPNGNLPFNELSGTAQKITLEYARFVTGKDYLSQKDIYVRKSSDGTINIMDAKKHTPLVPVTALDINLPANKVVNLATGNKREEEAIKRVNLSPASTVPKKEEPKKKKITW